MEHHAIGGESDDEQANDETQQDWFDEKDEANQAKRRRIYLQMLKRNPTSGRCLTQEFLGKFRFVIGSSITLWNEDPSMDQVLLGSTLWIYGPRNIQRSTHFLQWRSSL